MPKTVIHHLAAAPSHYHQGETDPLDLMAATGDDRPFAKGSILKYVHRHEDKGAGQQDLHKALFYLGWLIGCVTGQDVAGRRRIATGLVEASSRLVSEEASRE